MNPSPSPDSRPRLLLVDDEPTNLQVLRHVLQDDYRLLFATDGERALALAAQQRPDLVLLDVMMPIKTGFDVCHEVRASEDLRDTKILMLTAKGRDTDVAKGLALGADAYMTKPFSTKELVAKVQQMLEGVA